MSHEDINRKDGISPELDRLSSRLLGDALDLLAEGDEVNVLLVVQDASGSTASYEFAGDGQEACLKGTRDKVESLLHAKGDATAHLDQPVRYAIVYDGAVENEEGVFEDALLLEFGERGYRAWSAFSTYAGKGQGNDFVWSDPAPAGEIEPLL